MPEDSVIMFIILGEQDCEECGEGFVENDPKGHPCVFNVECPNHGDRQIIFHESCMPPEFSAAMENFRKSEKAWLN